MLLVAWSLLAWASAALLAGAEADPGAGADAIFVLAGSSTYIERTRHAARLFHDGRAEGILLSHDGTRSNWLPPEQRNPFFVEHARAELRAAGVPADRITILPRIVRSTHDEAVLLGDYAREQGLDSLLLVTSAYHAHRTLWTFRQRFHELPTRVAISPAPPGLQAPRPAAWWLRVLGWKMVPGEYVKIVYYRARFGV